MHDYVLSRDALAELEKKLNLRQVFSAESIDPFNRFTALEWDLSFESFYKYYRKRVAIDYDAVSSITVLTVRAYTAEDARNVNALLLRMSERLVNQLNDRSRSDLISVAEKEVKASEDRAKDASLALSSFRSRQSVFDPDRQAAMQLQGTAKLQEELLATETQLAQLRQVSPNNPQIPSLASRVGAAARGDRAGRRRGLPASSRARSRPSRRGTTGWCWRRPLPSVSSPPRWPRSRTRATRRSASSSTSRRWCSRTCRTRRSSRGGCGPCSMVFVLGLIVWGVLSLVVSSVREHTE